MCGEKTFILHEDRKPKRLTDPTVDEVRTVHWRERERRRQRETEAAGCRLQISHADTNHTEYSYIALREAQRVTRKYIRVIHRHLPFQPTRRSRENKMLQRQRAANQKSIHCGWFQQ